MEREMIVEISKEKPRDPLILEGLRVAGDVANNTSLFVVHGSTSQQRLNFIFRGYIRSLNYYHALPFNNVVRPIFINAGKENICQTMASKLYQYGRHLIQKVDVTKCTFLEKDLGYLRDLRPEDIYPGLLEVKSLIKLIYDVNGPSLFKNMLVVEMPDEFFADDFKRSDNFIDFVAFCMVVNHLMKAPIDFRIVISVGSRFAPAVFVEIRYLKWASEYYVE